MAPPEVRQGSKVRSQSIRSTISQVPLAKQGEKPFRISCTLKNVERVCSYISSTLLHLHYPRQG